MSLPDYFEKAEHYFEECMSYFKDYQQLYKHPNTDILVENVLQHIPINSPLNIDTDSDFEIDTIEDDFLKIFLKRSRKLTVNYDKVVENDAEINVEAPLSFKKKYEIVNLAKKIKDVCKDSNCDVVVDFGSGLGYLDQYLHEISAVKVLGLECNESNYNTAKKRQTKYHETSLEDVEYVKHTIRSESHVNLAQFLKENFPKEMGFCITGLHSCADLTVDAMNIFLKMADARSIIIMPCCYHKMVQKEENFLNFPLSNCLRNVYRTYEGIELFNIPFLRLAAQPTNCDDKMADLIFNMLSRAVLQLYAVKHNCTVKRKKRKAVRVKTLNNDFEFYVRNAVRDGFDLVKNVPNGADNKENIRFDIAELLSMWKDLNNLTFKKAGVLIKMQNIMQPVLENFILYDRIVYLMEMGVQRCSFRKIFDEKLSPRCLALIAHK